MPLLGKYTTSNWKTKNQLEKHTGKWYETGGWDRNKLDPGQRKIENLTSGSAGPEWTVDVIKRKIGIYINDGRNNSIVV